MSEDHRKRFLGEIAKLHTRFNAAAQAYEKDNLTDASEQAAGLLKEIDALLDDHLTAYPTVLREGKFASVADDTAHLRKRSGKNPPDSGDLLAILLRIEKTIGTLEREIRWAYPAPSKSLRFWRRYRWPLLGSAGAIVLVIVLITALLPKRGLSAVYYYGTDFLTLRGTRIDRRIVFDWGFNGPKGLKDNFSVRWTGFIRIPRDGVYEFITRSDDGVRLWVNNRLLIDNWKHHAAAVDRASATLEKGAAPIRLEYFDDQRHAEIELRWKPDGNYSDEPVPSSYLAPREEDIPKEWLR